MSLSSSSDNVGQRRVTLKPIVGLAVIMWHEEGWGEGLAGELGRGGKDGGGRLNWLPSPSCHFLREGQTGFVLAKNTLLA